MGSRVRHKKITQKHMIKFISFIRSKLFAWIMAGLLLISTIFAGGVANKYHQDLTRAQRAMTELSDLLNQKDARIEQLGNMNALTVSMTMNITTKNVLSISNQNFQNTLKEVTQLTRREILDSIYVWNNQSQQ